MIAKQLICLSGGFDPVHVGHIRMIQEATEFGDVMIILNSDEWLLRKKGYIFMPWLERKEILMSIMGVCDVVAVDDSDGTVCSALENLKPNYFGNGGDRTDKNTPEKELCERLDIDMIWGLGGGKIQSSSDLVKNVRSNVSERQWGL